MEHWWGSRARPLSRGQAQLRENAAAVGGDVALAPRKLVGDYPVGVSIGDQAYHRPLPLPRELCTRQAPVTFQG